MDMGTYAGDAHDDARLAAQRAVLAEANDVITAIAIECGGRIEAHLEEGSRWFMRCRVAAAAGLVITFALLGMVWYRSVPFVWNAWWVAACVSAVCCIACTFGTCIALIRARDRAVAERLWADEHMASVRAAAVLQARGLRDAPAALATA